MLHVNLLFSILSYSSSVNIDPLPNTLFSRAISMCSYYKRVNMEIYVIMQGLIRMPYTINTKLIKGPLRIAVRASRGHDQIYKHCS